MKTYREKAIDGLCYLSCQKTAQALRMIQSTKPIGRMSDIGMFLCRLPKSKTTRTMIGTTYIYKTKDVPSNEYVKKVNQLADEGQKLLLESANLIWGCIEANRTIGNKRYLEKGIDLFEAGLLTEEEVSFLQKLKEFWTNNPEANSGTVLQNGIIKPWYAEKKQTA